MKKLILVILAAFISSAVFCQTKISIDSVTKHSGEKVIVCSKVYGTKALEKVTFINLGAAYPNSLLTVVIFTKDKDKFKEAPEAMYSEKSICVTGDIKEYNGKLEIIVSSPDQITIQQMNTTLYEFNRLNECQKGEILFKYGEYISERFDSGHGYSLYKLNNFWIQVEYNGSINAIIKLTSFSNTTKLEPYLDKINLSGIIDQ